MSALPVEKEPADDAEEREPLEDALAEVTRQLVLADAARERLLRRRDQLMMDAREARRRKARGTLDAFLPPINLYGIEAVPHVDVRQERVPDEARAAVDAATSYERDGSLITMVGGQRLRTPVHVKYQ